MPGTWEEQWVLEHLEQARRGVHSAPLFKALAWKREESIPQKGCNSQFIFVPWKKNNLRKLSLEQIFCLLLGLKAPSTTAFRSRLDFSCSVSDLGTPALLDTQHKMKARQSCSGIWIVWAEILWLHEMVRKVRVSVRVYVLVCMCVHDMAWGYEGWDYTMEEREKAASAVWTALLCKLVGSLERWLLD